MSEQLIDQKPTAKASYRQSVESGAIETINGKVEQYIKRVFKCSRNDVQRALGLTSRQVGCACWHLEKQRKIRVFGTKVDEVSGRTVETLVIEQFPELALKTKSDKEKLSEIKKVCETGFHQSCYDLSQQILSIINS